MYAYIKVNELNYHWIFNKKHLCLMFICKDGPSSQLEKHMLFFWNKKWNPCGMLSRSNQGGWKITTPQENSLLQNIWHIWVVAIPYVTLNISSSPAWQWLVLSWNLVRGNDNWSTSCRIYVVLTEVSRHSSNWDIHKKCLQ